MLVHYVVLMCIISSAALLLDNWGCNYRNEVISNYRVSSSSLMSEEVCLIVGFLLRRTQLLFICLERCTFGPCDLWRSMVGCRFCTNWCNEALCYCRSIDGFHSRHGSFFFRVNQPGGRVFPPELYWLVMTWLEEAREWRNVCTSATCIAGERC